MAYGLNYFAGAGGVFSITLGTPEGYPLANKDLTTIRSPVHTAAWRFFNYTVSLLEIKGYSICAYIRCYQLAFKSYKRLGDTTISI
jgi:hypothetical protein